jgi:hypothetical protein
MASTTIQDLAARPKAKITARSASGRLADQAERNVSFGANGTYVARWVT